MVQIPSMEGRRNKGGVSGRMKGDYKAASPPDIRMEKRKEGDYEERSGGGAYKSGTTNHLGKSVIVPTEDLACLDTSCGRH